MNNKRWILIAICYGGDDPIASLSRRIWSQEFWSKAAAQEAQRFLGEMKDTAATTIIEDSET